MERKAHYSLPSLIALAAAMMSFFSGAFVGFILAMVAIVFGVFGVLLSVSPNIRGGFVSFISLAAGILGIVAAAIKALAFLI